MYAQDADRDRGARGAEDRADPGRTKKRRGGGATGGGGRASDHSALIPEDEWEYACVQIAQAFGQDFWHVYDCQPHGKPHLTWYAFYCLEESRRIETLKRDMDDFDRASMIGCAVNGGKGLDDRRKELKAKLRHDPSAPPTAPQWTPQEMTDAASRLMASVLAKGKVIQ